MKPLLGMLVMDRPRTTAMCFELLREHTDRQGFEWVVIDQNSNDETKALLRKWEKHFDQLITQDFNSGIVFGFNKIFSLRKPGQHCIKLDNDCLIKTEWLGAFEEVIEDEDVGAVLGRRPTFWIDAPGRKDWFDLYVEGVERHGIWCEFVGAGGLVGCFWMINGRVMDELGFFNEASNNDDIDYSLRLKLHGKKVCYIPDAVILQPQDEVVDHPQAMANKALVAQRALIADEEYQSYLRTMNLYRGTRFIPATVDNLRYLELSDQNYQFFEDYHVKNS